MKYFVQVSGKWKAVEKDEADRIMKVKTTHHDETHKENKALKPVRSHAEQPSQPS